MAYNRVDWESLNGAFWIVDKYHSHRAMPKNPLVRERRKRRTGETTLTQEQVNLRQRVGNLTRLLMDNFHAGDWWLTFKLFEPVSKEEFKKGYDRMLAKLRREFAKRGHDLKYIAVQENLNGRGRMHGHIIIPNIMPFSELRKIMQRVWDLGDCHIKPYGGSAMDARRLASYMTKEDAIGKAIREKTQLKASIRKGLKVDGRAMKKLDAIIKPERSRICPSRNLVRTKPKKTVIHEAETYREEIKAPKGYHVVKELSYNGWTVDGYPWQHAVFERDGT